MAKREILAGVADQTIDVFINDSSSTTGAGLTGLAFNTASLTCYYRKGATGTPTALTLATQTVGGAHSDGGFVAVDGTNCPGQYRLDLSDTIVATAGMVYIHLKGAANMVPCVVEIEVVGVDKFDAVRMGLSSLPNAAANANGGLPILSSSGTTLGYTVTTVTNTGTLAGAATVVLTDASLTTAKLGTFALAKTTNITGFNDIAATAVVSGGAITTSGGAVSTVTNTTQLNGAATVVPTDGAITAAKFGTGAIDAAAIASDAVTEIQSGLATSTQATSILTRLLGAIPSNGTIGTGNTTTSIVLPAVAGTANDDLNNWGLVLYDNSATRYYYTLIRDWTASSTAATVDTLPFTPENSVDLYWLLPVASAVNVSRVGGTDQSAGIDMPSLASGVSGFSAIKTVVDDIPTNAELATALTGMSTLDAAGVRTAVGLASANLDTQLLAIVTDTNEVQTDLANGGRLDLLIDSILADTDSLDSTKLTTARAATLTDLIDGGRLDLIFDAINLVTTRLATGIELDGATYRWTTNALEQAPGGSTSVTLMPVSGAATIGNVLEGGKIIGQFGAPLTGLTITCTTTSAGVTSNRDLTAYSGDLSLVVFDNDDGQAVLDRVVEGANITVSSNVATVSSTASHVLNTVVSDNLRWELRETGAAPSIVFAKGQYVCQRGPLSTAN